MVSLSSVSYTYPGSATKTLDNISLDIERGEFVTVMGANGSGKSTLSRILNGLLRPSSGTVLVSGHSTVENGDGREARKRVALVFQNSDNQITGESVEDDVAFAPRNLGLDREEVKERVEEALSALSLSDKRYHSPSSLSGGEKARLALASALASRPDVLVLDEASSFLDRRGREILYPLLLSLKERGVTVINITHDAEEAMLSEHLIVLDGGKVTMDAAPLDVFISPLWDRRLPRPFAVELSRALGGKYTGASTLEEIAGRMGC